MKEKGKGWPQGQHGPETALSWTSRHLLSKRATVNPGLGSFLTQGLPEDWKV
jgi:hypothetical protein